MGLFEKIKTNESQHAEELSLPGYAYFASESYDDSNVPGINQDYPFYSYIKTNNKEGEGRVIARFTASGDIVYPALDVMEAYRLMSLNTGFISPVSGNFVFLPMEQISSAKQLGNQVRVRTKFPGFSFKVFKRLADEVDEIAENEGWSRDTMQSALEVCKDQYARIAKNLRQNGIHVHKMLGHFASVQFIQRDWFTRHGIDPVLLYNQSDPEMNVNTVSIGPGEASYLPWMMLQKPNEWLPIFRYSHAEIPLHLDIRRINVNIASSGEALSRLVITDILQAEIFLETCIREAEAFWGTELVNKLISFGERDLLYYPNPLDEFMVQGKGYWMDPTAKKIARSKLYDMLQVPGLPPLIRGKLALASHLFGL
jgi:hypothetical protein